MLAILLNGIYFLLWFIVTPIIPIIFIYRILSGKENYKRIYERIGYSSLKRPNKKLIWVNAVSLGELRSTIPLIKILLQQNYSILITTVTLTSASHVKTIINKIDNKNILKSHNFLKNKKISDIVYAQKKATETVFKKKNLPFRSFEIRERNEKTLGELFCFFILETILLGRSLNVDPFDQPAVELIKTETKKNLV